MIPKKINKLVFLCLLLSSPLAASNDKFCNSTGIFYCAIKEAYPDTSKNCGLSPLSAIIPGVNSTSTSSFFPGGPGWSYEPWHFSSSRPATTKELQKGVAQGLIYVETWRNPEARPPAMSQVAEILVYNCKLCPSGTELKSSGDFSYCLVAPTKDPANNGTSCPNSTNHPINISTGNKHYHEVDYADGDFSIARSYNSSTGRWTFNYSQQLYLHSLTKQSLQTSSDGRAYYPHEIWALRQDGKVVRFAYQGAAGYSYTLRSPQTQLGLHLTTPDYNTVLIQNQGDVYLRDTSGLLLIANNQTMTPTTLGNTHELAIGQVRERYDIRGRLTQIQEPGQPPYELAYVDKTTTISRGNRQLKILNDAQERVSQIILPDESVIDYRYDSMRPQSNILLGVSRTYSNGTQVMLRQYFYEDSRFPGHITGVADEGGNRISSVRYDEQGRAISSEYGPPNSGIERSQIRYNSNGTSTVTNALGKDSTYRFAQFFGEYKITGIEGHPSSNCAAANKAYTYNANGFLVSKTDWKGRTTTYEYNTRGLEVSRTEASGTPQARTITTEWHPDFFLPLVVSEPDRITRYHYDDQGRQLSRTVEAR